MKKNLIIIFTLMMIFSSCNLPEKKSSEKDHKTTELKQDATSNDYLIMATLWFQKSAECRALSYQAFNWATKMLDLHLLNLQDTLPPCVVLDIDETVLDNSPFEGKCIKTGKSYSPEFWKEWSDLAQAKAIAGALDFCKYAQSKGVEVFYVSNRKINELEASIKNLAILGFPFADKEHFFLRSAESSKKARRELIAKNQNILLLIGDNLNDFDEIFESRQNDYGFSIVDDQREEFGNRFILLPNPMYGSWEKPILNSSGNNKISKHEKRVEQIKSY